MEYKKSKYDGILGFFRRIKRNLCTDWEALRKERRNQEVEYFIQVQ